MIVRIDFSDELLQPLLQEHVLTGRSVQSLIQDALSFYNKCKTEIEGKEGYAIASGQPARGYFNNHKVLMGSKGE